MQTISENIYLVGHLILGGIKNERFEKKSSKSEKNITILDFMITFHNVALKIETSFKLRRCLTPL